MIELLLSRDGYETIPYKDPAFHVLIEKSLSVDEFLSMTIPSHWHREIEWVFVRRGTLFYGADGALPMLKAGDSVIINSNVLHGGHAGSKHCVIDSICFRADELFATDSLRQKYLEPVINSTLQQCVIVPNHRFYKEINALKRRLFSKEIEGRDDYQLVVTETLISLWKYVFALFSNHEGKQPPSPDLQAQRRMIDFIWANYSTKVTLDDIASSGSVSKSTCCKLFKQYTQQTPIEYLSTIRLHRAAALLKETDLSISQIALSCGFNHLSYFSKRFSDEYALSPKDYRRATREPTEGT